ncbi:MAG TPA: hypothetical protein VFV67_00695 [Actinophytocola sp.]|uniref:hypothetical protein n=1 Tax=Actinophytocola sp. TaxID=1872138 RepID=UPI002DBA6811|nr:hypothetical protein [Actinophytocola sp.]HEU5469141.1 hypothetical protein [Actinophytocola sp.]
MDDVGTVAGAEAMLGRDREVAAALTAAPGRPVEFHAPCGFGKSVLLGQVAARLSERSGVPALYLQVGGYGPNDLRQRLTGLLCTSDVPLSGVRATLLLDDVSLGPDELREVLDDLPRCTVIIGCNRPLLGRRGRSILLTGLPTDLARQALCRYLGRDLTAAERVDADRLCRLVGGQPLRLRQAAALVRDGRHQFGHLTRAVERDPDALDRLGIDALSRPQQRTLALLAFAAGALLPAGLVGYVIGRGDIRPILESLHERGLGERTGDRFGLAVRHADDYLALLMDELTLADAVSSIVSWIGRQEPGGAQALDAADAALSIISHAVEHRDWRVVADLATVIEPIFALAGRWNAWSAAVTAGLEATRQLRDLTTKHRAVAG